MRLGCCNDHGFTWVELIVVMTILGIMSAFVASRFMNSDAEVAAQTEVIKTHLRYAQLRSTNTDNVWYIQFSGSSYSLYTKGDAAPKLLPGGDSPTVMLPGGISVDSGSTAIVSFDNRGKPCTDQNAQVAQTTDRTLTVGDGSDSRTITITKNTGFIP